MKLIGVSQRIKYFEDINEYRDELDQKLIDFIVMSGYLPVPIPNTLVKTINSNLNDCDVSLLIEWINQVGIKGIILSGGDDIGKNLQRDFTEKILIKFAVDNQLALLGICRGMQMINSFNGGHLKIIENHNKVRHQVSGEINANVNSYHNNALIDVPHGFNIIAKSPDGVIEAIRSFDGRMEAWMWHPEREDSMQIKKYCLKLRELFE